MPSEHGNGRRGRPRGSQDAPHGSPGSSVHTLQLSHWQYLRCHGKLSRTEPGTLCISMAPMAHSQPENHVAMTADRAAELDSVSGHIGHSPVASFFNVRKGLLANSHPPSAEQSAGQASHRGEVSRPAGWRTTMASMPGPVLRCRYRL